MSASCEGFAGSGCYRAIRTGGNDQDARAALLAASRFGRLRYSAAQLRADLIDNDWDKTLDQLVDRDVKVGISHALIFQRVGETVPYAALVPIDQLGVIWRRQADVSEELIKAGRLGKR
ncbi:hypothetical protein [Burkholderia multivorans]|uniref:hypothetical protein n=1 Tax=Burkholderia multivorans TaxID=87883 RepID=UPI0011B24EC2|nr:hypothetical protein [Burkholderia multivorans]